MRERIPGGYEEINRVLKTAIANHSIDEQLANSRAALSNMYADL